MNCNEFTELLDALVDTELEPVEREPAEEHLRSCAECARLREVTLRVKRMVREKADRPALSASLKARLEERLGQQAPTNPPEDASSAARSSVGPAAKVHYLSLSNLAAAAAILVIGTLSFFFLPLSTSPQLEHFATAQEVRAAFLRSYDDATKQRARPRDDRELIRVVRNEIGVELEEISIPATDYLGWSRETVAGHRAIRLDFRPQSNGEEASKDAAIISVFLLPTKDTTFSESYLEELEGGHYCQTCVEYQGTIYCVRRDDFFMAAVSNVRGELATVVEVR